MRSTGEVMGIDKDFAASYAKAQLAAGQRLPTSGKIFLSMTDKYKPDIVPIAKLLVELGFTLVATAGTSGALKANNVACERVFKISEGAGGVQLSSVPVQSAPAAGTVGPA